MWERLRLTAVEDVEQLMLVPTMLLIDIRYAARSRWRPHWNKSALQARWGSRYTHERGLSNTNYKDNGKPLALVAPDSSVEGAADLLWKGYSLLLLCACRGDDETCHCQLVASLITATFCCTQAGTLSAGKAGILAKRREGTMSKVGCGGRGRVRLWRHISSPSWYDCHRSPHHTPIVSKRGGVGWHVGWWGRAGSRCGAGVPARPEPAPGRGTSISRPIKYKRRGSASN